MNTNSRWSLAAVDLLTIGELCKQGSTWKGSQSRKHHNGTIMAMVKQGYAEVMEKDVNGHPIIVIPTVDLVKRIPSNL